MIDLVPDLGIAAQASRAHVVSLEIVDDTPAPNRTSHVELGLVSGKVYKGKAGPFATAEATYGKLQAKLAGVALAMGGAQAPAALSPVPADLTLPPRTPQLEAEAQFLANTIFGGMLLFGRGANTQALALRWLQMINDPTRWGQELDLWLGPKAPAQ